MKSKRNLVSKHLSVFTYTDQGALLEDHPFVQNGCYYQGYIDADPESMVAVTTCFGGLLGSLQINGTVYEIKPKKFSSTFEHLIYKMYRRETESFPRGCGLTEEEIARQLIVQDDPFTLRQSSSPGWRSSRLTVEFTIVIDNHRFVYRDSNVSQVHEDVITVVNVINVHFSPLEVVIVLMALETWNKENLIDVETNLAPLLRRFCTWKKQNLDHRVRQDVGHLFVNYPYGISTGMAYVGGVCHSGFNCGIGSFRGLSTVSHQLGHNLGMLHNESKDSSSEKSLHGALESLQLSDLPDIGDVEDGTGCAPNHMCINRKCVHMSALISHCSPKTCSLNGICNNRDHYHCNPEWSPPHCKEKGGGGSVDSGPTSLEKKWQKIKGSETKQPDIISLASVAAD
ncbi:hypothetical protein U0070_023248, partial [Myodes glareolus]